MVSEFGVILRLQLPTVEEIDALLADRKQTAIVFFLDETFEELEYDATTTVLEAVEFLAGVIKLQNYQTFTLYECRKVNTSPHRTACTSLFICSSQCRCTAMHADVQAMHLPVRILIYLLSLTCDSRW